MALELNGNYYRISKENIKQNLENVLFNIYKDKDTRLNPWKFDITPQENKKVEISDEFLNKVITELYTKLKLDSSFEGSKDV